MEIAIIDADLIGRKRHRFPNLCCMKLSGYFKAYGWHVTLKTDYDNLADFDRVYVAKVFSDTPTPDCGLLGDLLNTPNVIKDGTGLQLGIFTCPLKVSNCSSTAWAVLRLTTTIHRFKKGKS